MIFECRAGILGGTLHLPLAGSTRRLDASNADESSFRYRGGAPEGIAIDDMVAHHGSTAGGPAGTVLRVNRLACAPLSKCRLFGSRPTTANIIPIQQSAISITNGHLSVMRFVGYRPNDARKVVVVYEDRRVACEYIVRVDVGDGEVVHPLVAGEVVYCGDRDLAAGSAAAHAGAGAVALEAFVVVDQQAVSGFELARVDPVLFGRVPEGMVLGGLEDRRSRKFDGTALLWRAPP
nr:hypothetical protein [Micromonospora rubida]